MLKNRVPILATESAVLHVFETGLTIANLGGAGVTAV
jgi:hypothetical protein